MTVLINVRYMQEDVLRPNLRNNNMDNNTRVRCNTRILKKQPMTFKARLTTLK